MTILLGEIEKENGISAKQAFLSDVNYLSVSALRTEEVIDAKQTSAIVTVLFMCTGERKRLAGAPSHRGRTPGIARLH